MGLGKTVQVLAFLCAIQRKTGRPSDEALLNRSRDDDFPVALVVCPASVLDNWQEEARRWGYFAVEVARTNEKMEQVLEMLHRRKLDMVIMSYAKLRHFNQVSRIVSKMERILQGHRGFQGALYMTASSMCPTIF